MVFERFLRVSEWLHPQEAAFQIHRFSIDLGVFQKTVDVFLIERFLRVFQAKNVALSSWL